MINEKKRMAIRRLRKEAPLTTLGAGVFFKVFQTIGWLPGTKISYYAERSIDGVGLNVVTQ